MNEGIHPSGKMAETLWDLEDEEDWWLSKGVSERRTARRQGQLEKEVSGGEPIQSHRFKIRRPEGRQDSQDSNGSNEWSS